MCCDCHTQDEVGVAEGMDWQDQEQDQHIHLTSSQSGLSDDNNS